ncbi:MAG TPA: hypothetical protein VFU47_04715 [Armatimonadota bacterium]|nr:hypothetical protein [Armatimonadota bacterium]
MTAHKIYWKVRDALVEWGLVSRPRFYLQRHAAGAVRSQLMGRGTSRRFRRTSLPRLLNW